MNTGTDLFMSEMKLIQKEKLTETTDKHGLVRKLYQIIKEMLW